MKFNSDTSHWTLLADKYKVREYIISKGYGETLPILYGVWDNVKDIDFTSLPNKFVLKANNGAGSVMIINDKNTIDQTNVISKLDTWLSSKFGLLSAEPHYLKIPPKIIAEEVLVNDASFSSSLIDYKIWCFNGRVFGTWCCFNREFFCADTEWHDIDWNYRPEWSVFTDHYRDGGGIVPKPSCYDEMIKYASDLSKGFPQVRVDIYAVNNHIYFGEMTFTSHGGHINCYSKEVLEQMGNLTII